MKKEVLRMEHVTVRYAGRNVLEDFHLNIYEGEFLFVYGYPDSGIRELGELLRGDKTAETGRFFVGGTQIPVSAFENPGSFGMYLVQNENNLVDGLTVAENLFLGGKKRLFQRVVPQKQQIMMAQRLLEKFGLEKWIDPSQKAEKLTYEEQILLKMVMAYARGAKLVVLDRIMGFDIQREDSPLLGRTLRSLQEDGIAILWMNQRMDAAWDMADRVLMMQKGRNVRTIYRGYEGEMDHLPRTETEYGKNALRSISDSRKTEHSSTVVFELEHLSTSLISDMSLQIREGEVVGICSMNARLMRNWRNILTGMEEEYTGNMKLDGKLFQPRTYSESREKGVCYLDIMWYERHANPALSIEDNIVVPLYWHRKGLYGLHRNSFRKHVRYLYRLHYPDWPKDDWWKLSSDQQKILLLEQMCMEPHRLVIITEPFFQLHNEMLEDMYRMIRKVQDHNGAVVLMAVIDKDIRPVTDRVVFLDQWQRE